MLKQSDMQRAFRREATHRWNVKSGATRSGKTYGDYFLIPKRLMDGHGRDGLNVFLGNTRGTLQRNLIDPMQTIYGTALVSDIRSDNTATLFGEPCFCLGADNIRRVNQIRGASIKYCYGDEVTTWHQGVFDMLKSRLDKPYSLFDGTCNPESPSHWFKQFLDSDADIYQQAYTIYDNPFNPPSFVRELEREYRGTVYFDRYIMGRWKSADGAVYRSFADAPTRYLCDTGKWIADYQAEHKQSPLTLATIGVDFGGNGSGHAFVCTGFTRGLRKLVSLDEWYHKGEITPEKLERAFVDFAAACVERYGAHVCYADSAETTLIQGLRAACIREHVPMDVRKARKGAITDRIRFLCRMMAVDRYRIDPRCTHLRDALETAVWSSKHLDDVRLDDGTTNIDSLDALEYSYEPYMADMTALTAQKEHDR